MASSESTLLDLPDHIIATIFSFLDPLPHLFYAGRSCLRFKRLLHDQKNWLLVAAGAGGGTIPPNPYSNTYRSLEAAVLASRPGDTICVAPGAYSVRCTIVVQHTLHICGAGGSESDAVICSPKGASVFEFRATCKVTKLSMRSTLAPCVLHSGGQLLLERCNLYCNASGLDYLCAPVLTTAVVDNLVTGSRGASALPPPQPQPQLKRSRSVQQAQQQPQLPRTPLPDQQQQRQQQPQLPRTPTPDQQQQQQQTQAPPPEQQPQLLLHIPQLAYQCAAPTASPGKLTVYECKLSGGSRAVQCKGSGAISGVRVIYGTPLNTFYFEVDCRVPGSIEQVGRQALGQGNIHAGSCPDADSDRGYATTGLAHGATARLAGFQHASCVSGVDGDGGGASSYGDGGPQLLKSQVTVEDDQPYRKRIAVSQASSCMSSFKRMQGPVGQQHMGVEHGKHGNLGETHQRDLSMMAPAAGLQRLACAVARLSPGAVYQMMAARSRGAMGLGVGSGRPGGLQLQQHGQQQHQQQTLTAPGVGGVEELMRVEALGCP